MIFERFYQELIRNYGPEAAVVRHEVFFISEKKPRYLQFPRALLALLRDLLQILMLGHKRIPELESAEYVFCVTLPAANGWGTLNPFARELGLLGRIIVVHHPRLGRREGACLPVRPGLKDVLIAFLGLLQPPVQGKNFLDLWIIRFCLVRYRLWHAVWQETFRHIRNSKALLLHNDFDVFSRAAVEAVRSVIPSVCIQHGLPTDEFFPVSAKIQWVWGSTSAEFFKARSVSPTSIMQGAFRGITPEFDNPSEPLGLALVSQSHTPIFGRSLSSEFCQLAIELANTVGTDVIEILLHPEESRSGHPYDIKVLGKTIRRSPHAIFRTGEPKKMVVGFCSTALIDAACQGHYVVGLGWKVPSSLGAYEIGSPPCRLDGAVEVVLMFQRLKANEKFRRDFLIRQRLWLEQTFVPADVRELQKLLMEK